MKNWSGAACIENGSDFSRPNSARNWPIGRALIAELADNEFLVAGFHCRVDFQTGGPNAAKQREYLRVEEGTYEKGKFKFLRVWNGDQTDWGLNFASAPQLLRVTPGTY